MSSGEGVASKTQKMGIMKKIIILHGWAYETEKWKNFVDALKSNKVSVELLKIPGLTEYIDRPWKLEDFVEWLHVKVTQQKDDVILLGHSNGGRIALSYCLRYPKTVKKLVILDSAGVYHNELPIRIKRAVFKTIAKIGRKFTKSEKLRLLLYKLTHERDYAQASEFSRDTMKNMINVDLASQLPTLKVSTLIMWGECDVTTPYKDGKLMHSLIPNSQLLTISGARHSPQFTHTDEVCKAILNFINP